MSIRKNTLSALMFVLFVFTFAIAVAPHEAQAGGKEYKAIVRHLKTKYQAKKVNIPMLWLARFAVSVVRPAGVKSFSITMFENLRFSRPTLDQEMQSALRDSFSEEWSPVFRVRSREGQQAYMYMREAGTSIQMTLVTIDKNQAAVIRAKFNPEKFAEFVNDPKIFGISLNDNDQQARNKDSKPKAAESATQEKKDEQK
jgi:hypothetical protein